MGGQACCQRRGPASPCIICVQHAALDLSVPYLPQRALPALMSPQKVKAWASQGTDSPIPNPLTNTLTSGVCSSTGLVQTLCLVPAL